MRPISIALIAGLFVAAMVVLTNYYVAISPTKHADTVFNLEAVLNVAKDGRPTSETLASWAPALETFTTPPEELCIADLGVSEPSEKDIIQTHALYALYAIGWLTAITTPETAFSVLNAMAHLLLLFTPVLFLWRRVGILPALVFGLWVALYPVWSFSAVGDYYPDRLYMPFGLISLFLMFMMLEAPERLRDWRWLAAWATTMIIAASFTERAALMMVGQIAFFTIFFPEVRRSSRALAVGLGVALALGAYLAWYLADVQVIIAGGGDLLGNIQTDLVRTFQKPEMRAFVAVNVGLASLFVVAAGARYLLLVLGAFLPNLLISVGGAELNGWSTHYHAMYLPFVLFVATIGYGRLVARLRGPLVRLALVLGVGVYALAFGASIDPYSGRPADRLGSPLEYGIANRVLNYYFSPSDPMAAQAILNASLDDVIPRGVSVSTVEAAMPSLYRDRSLSYFPIGMDDADYLVLPGVVAEGRVESIIGDRSYLGQEASTAINACLLSRAVDDGFELYEQVGGWVVLKRTG